MATRLSAVLLDSDRLHESFTDLESELKTTANGQEPQSETILQNFSGSQAGEEA